MVEYAQNMGAPFRHILDSDFGALSSLAYWGGLSSVELDTLTSWTGEPIGDVRMRFRGEVFVSRALRNPVMRGCPICLREDAQHHTGASAEAMAMRGDWQFREVTLCLRHNHLLMPLWRTENRYARNDFAARFAELLPTLMAGALDRPQCEPTGHDGWLDRRLETGEDPTWLAYHGLYAATAFCRLLGTELLRFQRVPTQNEVSAMRSAQQAGFAVARQGEAAISAAFQSLADAADGALQEPQAAFGSLFTKLRQDYRDDPAFDPFRSLLRACILSVWPVAAGETVLGEVQLHRRLHSLYSAAAEIGTTEERLEPFLIEAGALVSGDTRFSNRRVFSAVDHAALLAEVPTFVSQKTLMREIGASRTELATLVAEGMLIPRYPSETVRLRWSLVEARSLLDRLTVGATRLAGEDPDWVSLLRARATTGLTLRKLTDAVGQGVLTLALLPEGRFRDLRVRLEDVEPLAPKPDLQKMSLIPATAFGLSVGIRDKGRFRALILAGHTPATWVRPDKARVETAYMSPVDVAAFHRRFVTIRTLAEETGQTIPALTAALERAQVAVFSTNGADFGKLYLRDAVKTVISRKT